MAVSGGANLAAVVGGFAPLDSGLLVPRAYLGTGTPSASNVLRGDGTWGGGITPSTVGTTSIGGTWNTTRGWFAKKFTLSATAFLASINAYVKGNGTNATEISGLVMADNAGVPGLIMSAPYPSLTTTPTAMTSMILAATGRWMSIAVARLLAAGTYWMVVGIGPGGDTNYGQIAYDSTGPDYSGLTADMIKDGTVSALTAASRTYSIYGDLLT